MEKNLKLGVRGDRCDIARGNILKGAAIRKGHQKSTKSFKLSLDLDEDLLKRIFAKRG